MRSPPPSRTLAEGWSGALLLVALCAAVYAPGFFSLPPIDRDESRFAQASRQMFEAVALPETERDVGDAGGGAGGSAGASGLHSGGLAVPMLGRTPRLNKPPLIYWLQAGSAAVLTRGDPETDAIWMYRVPSLLAAIAAVLLTWRIGASMFDPRVGWLAGAMLAVCPLVAWESRQARADMVLLAVTTAAIWGLWELWKHAGPGASAGVAGVTSPTSNPSSGPSATEGADVDLQGHNRPPSSLRRSVALSLFIWLCIGLGVLVKGPITPMVVLLTALVLSALARRWRWFWSWRFVAGLGLVVVMVGPWVAAVASHVGWGTYAETVYAEVIGRSASPKEGHWGPPGYHTVLMVALFWPGSLLTGVSLVRALRRGIRLRNRPGRKRGHRLSRLSRGFTALAPARPAECFLLAWLLPAWLVFELVSTKLPHYTMPMYPALALLSARGVYAAAAGALTQVDAWFPRIGHRLWLVMSLFLCFGFAGAMVALPPREGTAAWIAMGVLLLGAAVALGRCMRAVVNRAFLRAQAWSIAAAGFTVIGYVALLGPGLFGLTTRAIEAMDGIDPGGERPLAAVEFHEDSLEFLTRARIDRINEADLPAWLDAQPGGLVLAPRREEGRPGLVAIESVRGVNYSKGRIVTLEILEAGP